MLTEEEWELVAPGFENAMEQIMRYREECNCSLVEARKKGYGQNALAQYEEITGFKETNADALFHHRLIIYGPPCHGCGKPLRTPRAKYCAMCGEIRPVSS